MERQLTEYGLMLSFRDTVLNNNDNGFVHLAIKKLFAALRKRAAKENWEYSMLACPSVIDPRNGRAVRLHIHIYLKGEPGATICQWIREYWHKRYGMVDFEKVHKSKNIMEYMKMQSFRIYHQRNTDALLL